MRYIKVENNIPIDYSIEQLFEDCPTANIYKRSRMPSEKLLANYNVYPLITEPVPETKEDETAVESTPEFRNGEWHQTWTARKLTKSEIEKKIENKKRSFDFTEDETSDVLASKDLQKHRYEICKSCDSFTTLKICQKCACIMPLKVKLIDAECPLKKW